MHTTAFVIVLIAVISVPQITSEENCCWCGKTYVLGPTVAQNETSLRIDNDMSALNGLAPRESNLMIIDDIFSVGVGQSLYTTEKTAEIFVRGSGNATKVIYVLSAFSGKQELISNCRILNDETASVCPFDLSSLKRGQYSSLSYKISTANNATIQSGFVNISYWPDTANAVKVDNIGGGLIVGDRSLTLSVGYFVNGADYTYLSENLQREAGYAFNSPLIFGLPYETDVEATTKVLDVAHTFGRKVIIDIAEIGQENNTIAKEKALRTFVETYRSHPALLAYYFGDEPDGQGASPDWMANTYNTLKTLDPYHPSMFPLNCWNNSHLYTDFADIIMVDPYPIALMNPVGCDFCKGNVNDVRLRVERITNELNRMKPVWIIPQAFGGVQHWYRLPSGKEIRAMTYLSIVEGATGVIYFPTNFMFGTTAWASARAVSMELNELAPAIVSRSNGPKITIDGGAYARSLAHHTNGNAITTIIVANPSNEMLNIRVRVQGAANINMTVLWEDRKVSLKNQQFEDFLEPYGSHVYQFGEETEKVQGNNLIYNPSFEQSTLPGIPDGYQFGSTRDGHSMILDPINAFRGSRSLKVRAVVEPISLTPFNFYLQAGRYNFSYFAKTEKLCSVTVNGATFNISSPQWTFYSHPWTIAEKGIMQAKMVFQPGCSLWLDDLSLYL